MSQTPEQNESGQGSAQAIDFDSEMSKWREDKARQARRGGPRYNDPETDPLVWYDQVFERELTPSGIVNCGKALGVGATQNGLDVLLIGSHANAGKVSAAAGATVTLVTLQADERDGEYEAVGPSLCVTAPEEGISAEADSLFCRLPLGNFRKPWLKIRLTFSGSISGGSLDAVRGYVPR